VPVAGNKDYSAIASHRFDPSGCEQNSSGQPRTEKVQGAQASGDTTDYFVCHNTETAAGPVGRYLVNQQGAAVYLSDPGINGVITERPGGGTVTKYNAPKATLMSYIIKGILSGQLPWGLVLLGVFIAIVLELSGIPSLAFAVGVYLPISTSAPIFVGGMVRYGVDKYLSRKLAHKKLTEEQLVAEGDKSGGVLLASGYIAGGALAGVLQAFLNLKESIANKLTGFENWATANNPFFNGYGSDLLALIPFAILTLLLYLVGRELWLAPPRATPFDVPPPPPPRDTSRL
jgi:hypothetical protein